jgi:two-component system NtrC family sensor kinase
MPPEQMPGAVERMLRSGLRCKEIVDRLLEFGRSVSGEPKLTDINQLVRDSVQAAYAGPDSVRIAWDLGSGLGCVRCSVDRIALVLHHLIDNALHTAHRDVRVTTSGDSENAEVRVWNDGPPIPPEARGRIFPPFSSPHNNDSVVGLSLSLSRAVAQEHGGDLFVEDGKGEGSCFVLRLPLGGAATVEASATPTPPPAMPPSKRVLIVEDDPDQVFLLKLALQTRGHEVDTAAAGAQALELLSSQEYSAIVIDILLGDELGGKDLYKILLRSDPTVDQRTIFVTGDTMKYETRQFLNEVKCPYLEKPFMITQFTTEVENILATVPLDVQH